MLYRITNIGFHHLYTTTTTKLLNKHVSFSEDCDWCFMNKVVDSLEILVYHPSLTFSEMPSLNQKVHSKFKLRIYLKKERIFGLIFERQGLNEWESSVLLNLQNRNFELRIVFRNGISSWWEFEMCWFIPIIFCLWKGEKWHTVIYFTLYFSDNPKSGSKIQG